MPSSARRKPTHAAYSSALATTMRLRILAAALALVIVGCAGEPDEVGGSPTRPSQNGGQGGVGSLPGASGQGGAAAGAAGGISTGSGGSVTGFALRASGIGRGPDPTGDGPGPRIRFGGLSPLGRVCSETFCVTGDLR